MGVALVTGSSRGLGLELVRQLAGAGEPVLATCRRPEDAEDLAAVAASHPDRVTVVALDVTDPDSAAACAEALSEDGRSLDLVANCAGVWDVGGPASRGPLGQLAADALLDVLRTNCVGPLLVTQALAPHLARGAVVVNLSSGLGSLGRDVPRGNYGYAVSKAGLHMVTRYLAADLADDDVRVVALDPGWVRTDMGGPSAPLDPRESVAGLREVLAGLGEQTTGCFLNRHGEVVPW